MELESVIAGHALVQVSTQNAFIHTALLLLLGRFYYESHSFSSLFDTHPNQTIAFYYVCNFVMRPRKMVHVLDYVLVVTL